MSTQYTVWNQLKPIEFKGTLLGSSSTRKRDSYRWTEIHIYRTDGGAYIIERLGKSVIYHAAAGKCDVSKGLRITGSQILDSSEPCDRCDPAIPEDDDFNPEDPFVHEQTMSSAQVVKEAGGVHDALVMYDSKRKISRMSHVATDALQKAAGQDPDLLNSVISPVIVP